jgi:L-seryl-tRNA(Ser) seleniumtransferase
MGDWPSGASLDNVPTFPRSSAGSLTATRCPPFALVVTMKAERGRFGPALRTSPATPVYGRIERDRLLLDLRTVDEAEEAEVAAALTRVLVG